jgi:peptide/nickel transport system permease protein
MMIGIIWHRFKRNRLAVVGLTVILIIVSVAIAAPIVAPYDPFVIDVYNVISPPTSAHLLGTDDLGRDVLSRMIWGSRISLAVGFVAVGISITIGIIIGALAGFYGKAVDAVLMRFVDIMLCFPTLFLILAVIAIIGPSIWVIMVIIGTTSWMDVARLVRAEILTLKERDFVAAARAVGASDFRIIFRHILPNALSPVFVSATLGVAGAILLESGLSFLGLGVQPPDASWGNILTSGKDYITVGAWWLSFFPGMAILFTVLSYNLVGEGLRDATDPRLWRSGR